MHRLLPALLFLLAPLAVGCADGVFTEAPAEAREGARANAATMQRAAFPDIIPLPDGFQPEGIATAFGTRFYAGSLADGRIYSGDLRTGEGSVLVEGNGLPAVGLDVDERSGLLWVSGGPSGNAYVYDASTGEEVASYAFGGAFVNDVIVTRTAAYFTDSFAAVYYRVPLGPGGEPGDTFEAIPLSGDFERVSGFNANGIVATPNGKTLIIVNSTTGTLYTVDPMTGEASAIDTGEDVLTAGDGLLLDGRRTLYVVRNQLNQIAEVELSPDLSSGKIVNVLTSPAFDIPTTAADLGNALYAVNARFGTPSTPSTEYQIVRVRK